MLLTVFSHTVNKVLCLVVMPFYIVIKFNIDLLNIQIFKSLT